MPANTDKVKVITQSVCAAFHRLRPRPDRRQLGLLLFATVPDRRQKLRVHPRQRLRVGPVVLLHSRSGEFRAAAQRIRETLARPVERALPRGVVLAGGAHRALSLRLRILD